MAISISIGPMPRWYAVDLDKTLAKYNGFQGNLVIGEPVPESIKRVKGYLKDGHNVSIFTSRVADQDSNPEMKMQIIMSIQAWCQKNIGQILEITAIKSPKFTDFEDDRNTCIQPNTGKILYQPKESDGA